MEPALAVNPTDPANVIVTYHQMWVSHDVKDVIVPSPSEVVAPIQSCFFAVSWDRGRSWTRRRTPTVDAPVHDPVMTDCSDQLVVFDLAGTVYLFSSAYNPAFAADEDRVIVSHDEGRTWSVPVVAAGSTFTAGRSPIGQPYLLAGDADRMWVSLDDQTHTLYLDGSEEWADTAGAGHNVVWVTSSTDGAQRWSTQRVVNGPVPVGTMQNNPVIAAARGDVAVAYYPATTPGAPPPCSCVELAVSTNTGRTFAHLRTPIPLPAGGAGLLAGPYTAADPTHRGRFAVMVPDEFGTRYGVWVTGDAGGQWEHPVAVGEAVTGSRSHEWLAFSPAGVLTAMWRTYYPDGSYDVWAAVSPDGGASFDRPVRMTTMRSPSPRDTYVAGDDTGTIAFGPHHLYVAWADWRSGDESDIYWAGLSLNH